MKCYVCAKEGRSSDAVAVCIVCGMGLCTDHAMREELDVWEGGYPFPARRVEGKIPRILCPECYHVLKGE